MVQVQNRSILDSQSLGYRHNQVVKNEIYPLIEQEFDDYNPFQLKLYDPVYNNENDMYTSIQNTDTHT